MQQPAVAAGDVFSQEIVSANYRTGEIFKGQRQDVELQTKRNVGVV